VFGRSVIVQIFIKNETMPFGKAVFQPLVAHSLHLLFQSGGRKEREGGREQEDAAGTKTPFSVMTIWPPSEANGRRAKK